MGSRFWLFDRAYAATLRLCLRNVFTQLMVVLIAVVALGGGIYMVISGVVRTEFMPQEDDGSITISITMPAGTNLDATDQAARQAEQIVAQPRPRDHEHPHPGRFQWRGGLRWQ